MIVTSESEDDYSLAVQSGNRVAVTLTDTLGDKWNFGARAALSLPDWTHLMISGDDNLYDRQFLLHAQAERMLTNAPFMGISGVYMVDPFTRRACNVKPKNSPVAAGTGRILRRDVVEKLEGKIFKPEQNRELDFGQDMILLDEGHMPVLLDDIVENSWCMDIKTGNNIWTFDNFAKAWPSIPYEDAMQICAPREREMIDALTNGVHHDSNPGTGS